MQDVVDNKVPTIQIVVKLNVLAAWLVCLEPHCSAQENLELPRVRRFYRTRNTIRWRAARGESNPLRGHEDNPDGARLLPNYMSSAHPERVVSHAWTPRQTASGFVGRARWDANIFSAC